MLKHGVDEGYDIQIFDMLGVNVPPAGGELKGVERLIFQILHPACISLKSETK